MLRPRQKLGKYRIVRRLARGGFAEVWEARDTVEGISVALKLPHEHLVTDSTLADFRREVRLVAQLDHPNILALKTAGYLEGRFVIVYPLGKETLGQRLERRLSTRLGLSFAEQLLSALAEAHRRRIIHCDVKPDNVLLFEGDKLRLMDFGIAKVAARTVLASGSGTVGYVAPEQALGKPSPRSDVFSTGLILYRMFAGALPSWPFHWPPPRSERLQRRLSDRMIAVIRKAMEVDDRARFPDAVRMLAAFRAARPRAIRRSRPITRRATSRRETQAGGADWREVRMRQFRRSHGAALRTRHACRRCKGPVSEPMTSCPWCGAERRRHRGETDFPAQCPRCARGVKLDWRFCPWCWGAAVGPLSERRHSDRRYAARCANDRCPRRELMPFMRYCPWCHVKVRRPWPLPGTRERCGRCGWGVLSEYWNACPWCGASIGRRGTRRG